MGKLDGRTYLKTYFSPAAHSSLRDLLPLLAVKTDSEIRVRGADFQVGEGANANALA